MILCNEEQGLVTLHTAHSAMILRLDKGVTNLWWGGTVSPDDFAGGGPVFHSSFDQDVTAQRLEYPVWNARMFTEPCLIAGPEGNQALFFQYMSRRISENRLEIDLSEPNRNLVLTLVYEVFSEYDIISRSAVLQNGGDPIRISRFFSGCLSLPPVKDAQIRTLSGRWAAEFQIHDARILPGVLELQSKEGVTSHHANCGFALHGGAGEEHGEVWFGLLAYSGSWKIALESTNFGVIRAAAGRNDFDAGEILQRGGTLETPAFFSGYTAGGFGGMSRLLHRFERDCLLRPQAPRPVLYNSWEATAFDVNAQNQKELADRAAAMGVELFVVDDGWFGKRNSDRAGLGDWTVNRDKFPLGLGDLIRHVKGLGMQFGIWVEPEAVNPDSDLFRAHPDWIYRIPGTLPMTARNQYVLDLSLPEVRQYIRTFLGELLGAGDISYLKWDMNRPITDVYTESEGNGRRRREHTEGLYGILGWLKEQFPHVALESCSGGGGRIDLGILRYANTFWPSDHTDPYERLFIQEGYSLFYPPAAMTCWVTDSPDKAGRAGRCSVAYKFHSAFCGLLGIGSDIRKLSSEETQEYRRRISEYKEIRDTVQSGDLFRLSSPRTGFTAVEYIKDRQVVVLAFLHSQMFGDLPGPLRLAGLEPDAKYAAPDGTRYAGSTLMNRGIWLELSGDFSSCMIVLNRERQ